MNETDYNEEPNLDPETEALIQAEQHEQLMRNMTPQNCSI